MGGWGRHVGSFVGNVLACDDRTRELLGLDDLVLFSFLLHVPLFSIHLVPD